MALIAGLAALVELRQGQLSRARDWTKKTLCAVEKTRFALVELRHPLSCAAEILLVCPRQDSEFSKMELVLARLRKIARLFPVAHSNFFLYAGRYDWHCGRKLRAIQRLRRSLQAAISLSQKYEQAQAHYWLGCCTREMDGAHAKHAATHLASALALFQQLGAAWEEQATRMLQTG